jgi:hypothetical protein
MFDVYLSNRRDLLVLNKGFPIPLTDTSVKWRKAKKRVFSVSEEIRSAIQKQGYYVRRVDEFRMKTE